MSPRGALTILPMRIGTTGSKSGQAASVGFLRVRRHWLLLETLVLFCRHPLSQTYGWHPTRGTSNTERGGTRSTSSSMTTYEALSVIEKFTGPRFRGYL